MNRTLVLLTVSALALASIVLAQTSGSATLRTPAGQRTITVVEQRDAVYFPLDSVIESVGGTVARDGAGFLVTLGAVSAALAPDSRYTVIGDDLIEMPGPPLTIEQRAFVPIEFFSAVLRRPLSLEPQWRAQERVLELRPVAVRPVAINASAVDLEDFTKVVLELESSVPFQQERRGNSLRLKFGNPIAPAASEKSFDSRYVRRVVYGASDAVIEFTQPELAADVYTLENPYRVIVDVRAAAAPPSGTPGEIRPRRPVDLPGVRTIVLDPGHGGKEVGAIGPSGLVEKDLTLQIARRLASRLQQKLGVRVILTRDSDEVIPLEQRTALANRYKADLFLSIHLNASTIAGARGSETYFLSLDATDDAARIAAERENAASRGGAAPRQDDLEFILWDLAHTESLRESSRFAEMVQDEMNRIAGITNRGVKQAPFKVLVGATMPAALVELAFISNPEEEARLRTESFQDQLADSIFTAISRYREDVHQRISPSVAARNPAAEPAGER